MFGLYKPAEKKQNHRPPTLTLFFLGGSSNPKIYLPLAKTPPPPSALRSPLVEGVLDITPPSTLRSPLVDHDRSPGSAPALRYQTAAIADIDASGARRYILCA